MTIAIATIFENALAYHRANELEKAEALYRLILGARPGHSDSCNNLAVMLKRLGRLDEAERFYQQAIEANPQDPAPHYNHALLLEGRGKLDEARRQYTLILDKWPNYSGALNNLGVLLMRTGDAAGAVEILARSIDGGSTDYNAMLNLAAALRSERRLDEALERLKALVSIAPDWAMGWVELAMAAFEACDYAIIEQARPQIDRMAAEGHLPAASELVALCNIHYLSVMGGTTAFAAQGAAAEIARRLGGGGRKGSVRSEGALRIGYLSKNFGNHAIGHVSRSLYRNHDRQNFRVHIYSTGDRSRDEGPYHSEIRQGSDLFREVSGAAASVAEQIRQDGVDILVDLDGHMSPFGLEVMSLRPAPLQVFWLGVAGSPGLPCHDYLVADRVVARDEELAKYASAVVRLPDCYHSADRHEVDPTPPSREREGLPEDALVLCVFNNPQKYDQRILDCWMEILSQAPQAVLWMSHPRLTPKVAANLRAEAERRGVDGGRLFFARTEPDKGTHLRRHELADLFLDTITLTASTTALDVLWMGLPLVTCPGETWPSRIAASFLTCLGLEEFIVPNLEAYKRLILQLCASPAARKQARDKFQAARLSSPLFQIESFTRHLEAGFLGMAARARAGLPPASFDV